MLLTLCIYDFIHHKCLFEVIDHLLNPVLISDFQSYLSKHNAGVAECQAFDFCQSEVAITVVASAYNIQVFECKILEQFSTFNFTFYAALLLIRIFSKAGRTRTDLRWSDCFAAGFRPYALSTGSKNKLANSMTSVIHPFLDFLCVKTSTAYLAISYGMLAVWHVAWNVCKVVYTTFSQNGNTPDKAVFSLMCRKDVTLKSGHSVGDGALFSPLKAGWCRTRQKGSTFPAAKSIFLDLTCSAAECRACALQTETGHFVGCLRFYPPFNRCFFHNLSLWEKVHHLWAPVHHVTM